MLPKEFASKCREILIRYGGEENFAAHVEIRGMLEDVLESIGYGEGIDVLKEFLQRWY